MQNYDPHSAAESNIAENIANENSTENSTAQTKSNRTENSRRVNERILAADLAMDAVTLRVANLDLMRDYYADSLGLTPIEEERIAGETRVVLARGNTPLVRLIHTPELPEVSPREAGLYHTAFLFDTEAALAATVYSTAQNKGSTFQGSSDHLVSEAFYFADPEGNGIELYKDRPRSEWKYDGADVRMGSEFLDPNAYLQNHLTEQEVADMQTRPGRVGHVHLQVGDIAPAKDFYVDALGFETTFGGIPSALFASAGGYHHHVAMNSWRSRGAGPRAAKLGLADLAITLPEREDLDALAARLREKSLQFKDTGNAIIVDDPWGTQVTLALPGAKIEL